MIKTSALKAIRKITSNDETRIAICGIKFEAKRDLLLATDGRRLIAFDANGVIDSKESFIIPNAFIDALPNDANIALTFKDEIITAMLPDNVNYSAPTITEQFPPKWESVIPDPWPDKFDLRKLAAHIGWLSELCEVAEQLGEDPGFVVTAHAEEESPICIRSKHFTGLLMQIRAEANDYGKPSWFAE